MDCETIDARVLNERTEDLQTNVSFGSISIPIDSMKYDMRHKHRGKCLIYNHQTFDSHTGCKPRLGSDRDANAIAKCFHNLQFEVIQYIDISYRDLRQSLIKVSVEDHRDRDCIVVVILTHGNEDSLWARDAKYPVESLFAHFKGDRCPTLLGKPKIFIIQACRGELLDSGSKILALGSDVVDGPQTVYKIPTIADFVVYYSTAPGHYSFRNTERGSYFIQTLVSVLNQYCYKYSVDLLTLFTIVNQRVAYEFESYVPNSTYHKKKQIPCISSMLTRLIFFGPKQQPITGVLI